MIEKKQVRKVQDEATLRYYPYHLLIDEFVNEIKENIDDFRKSLYSDTKLYAEEWMDMFARWMEMK